MKVLRAGFDPSAFFDRLSAAPSRVLLLDYDGTLAPFVEARDEAVPYPQARDLVAAIQADGGTRVIVISGRALRDLRPLLGLDPTPELWGTHGWERLFADGRVEAADPGRDAASALDRAADLAEALAPRGRVERKPASVAVHARGLAEVAGERLLEAVRGAWSPLLETVPLALHDFDGGVELRVSGRDKGTAVREILVEEPEGAAVAYLGDDRTDEDAFEALGDRGLSVLVRSELRKSAADVWIRPPEELIAFLLEWRQKAALALRPGRLPT
jgi:trehalose 6-phosphate phosphatase